MPGAQGELRTFISHLHVCTFSINNVELKYVQSSLAHSQAIFPSGTQCQEMLPAEFGLFPPLRVPGCAASGPWDSPSPNHSVLSCLRQGRLLEIAAQQKAAPLCCSTAVVEAMVGSSKACGPWAVAASLGNA